jgi:hypothetical protein
MNAIKEFGPDIREIDKFVAGLDPAVRAPAFEFLLSRQFGFRPTNRDVAGETIEPILSSPVVERHRALAPQELLRRVEASTATEKAILLGYWLEVHQGQTSFSGSKLKEAFDLAREQSPVNPSDLVAKLEKAGRLMRTEKIGTTQYYRLTRTAFEEIEGKLNQE